MAQLGISTVGIASRGIAVAGISSQSISKGGVPGPYPPPPGFHWDYVTEDNQIVTENNIPVVELVRN